MYLWNEVTKLVPADFYTLLMSRLVDYSINELLQEGACPSPGLCANDTSAPDPGW